MPGSPYRWVLAFDASCARCRRISRVVEEVCTGKLEVLPLAHEDVRGWHEQARGKDAPWVPTLFRLDNHKVRAWSGMAMGLQLVRHLGVRSTMRLLRTFGGLELDRAQPDTDGGRRALSRKRFLRLGSGLGVAAGLVLTGRASALAAAPQSSECARAQAWVKKNLDRLPQQFDEFAAHPPTYRKAIFAELSPEVRSGLWKEQLRRYAAEHPHLSQRQQRVVDTATAVLGDKATFADRRPADVDRKLAELREAALAAFGRDGARRLVATLGPDDDTLAAAEPECECSHESDYCFGICLYPYACRGSSWGCGTGLAYPCDGRCL
jgi:hypothetical protein